ncbi:TIGR03013 family XrtA/PEP-CTERM system glycosyltransferase [Echinimonas agarilytica]|uniref:TIGR03013 family PEP-CTERM/XrtA system glycosyltransferase n=1 Tax=Echinimonas agarilytica TaxID=1215918 RepID=A0AA41W995_9GAMM|nr:TIGR03013 family XrtA/PEP-CTERM system glycosyltransferase [Echinimonas agarilytica]MCM2681470.1 TIGR03013 family PEP-CTERM/XrtA system glycosyltransferase [Echinimonas agarilytica]
MTSARFHDIHSGTRLLFIVELIVLTAIYLVGLEADRTYFPDAIPKYWEGKLVLHFALFVFPIQLSILSVGLYNRKMRETFRGVIRRMFVSIALGYFISTAIYGLTPAEVLPGNVREWSCLAAFISLVLIRYMAVTLRYQHMGRQRVLILGAGERASIIERRMRRRADRVSFDLVGFVKMRGDAEKGIESDPIIELNTSLEAYVFENKVDEIVVASDERRSNLPVDSLFHCKLHGVEITDILDFIERETGQIAVNLIYPSWVIYSNGFQSNNYLRNAFDWLFNGVLAIFLLAITWPFMLLTAILIKIEDGLRSPVFYSQERIGLNGRPFKIVKFRSMTTDAEKNGAQMATKGDARVTRVGNFIRKYRIDELPQLYNVLRGEMGFVGPRPERPYFVRELVLSIPYYNQRHNVKPGLTGWAQLKYPYGSTEEDSLEKLKFDLYYIKHRSFLLDLLILVRTLEIVIFGKGI